MKQCVTLCDSLTPQHTIMNNIDLFDFELNKSPTPKPIESDGTLPSSSQSAASSSSVAPAATPEPTLEEEVSQALGQLGRFWGGFRAQVTSISLVNIHIPLELMEVNSLESVCVQSRSQGLRPGRHASSSRDRENSERGIRSICRTTPSSLYWRRRLAIFEREGEGERDHS